MKQKMYYSQVSSNISKYDSFINSDKTTASKKALHNYNDSYFEIEQKEVRKFPAKKISFKIKKNPSFIRRRTIEVQRHNSANSSHVAQLTQKFNSMVTERDQLNESSTTLSQINTRQDSSTKYNKPTRKPSIKTKTTDKTLETTNSNLLLNENEDQRNLIENILKSLTSESDHISGKCIHRNRLSDLKDTVTSNDFDKIIHNNNNVVQTAINIFERKNSLCDNSNSLKRNSDVKLGTRMEQCGIVSNYMNNIKQTRNNAQNKSTTMNEADNNIVKEISTSGVNEKTNEDIFGEVPLNDNHGIMCQETINFNVGAFKLKLEEDSGVDSSDFSSVSHSITPNSSFLWRDKCNTNFLNKTTANTVDKDHYNFCCPVKLPPRSDKQNVANTMEMGKSHNYLGPQMGMHIMTNCSEGVYEKLDNASTEENIYEIMFPIDFKQGEVIQTFSSGNNSNSADELDNSISNCYESIYSKDYKKLTENESIYESVYERTISSNRDSLVSCEQNSNSLYGKNLWESEDDSIYKPVSDLSDEWVDVTDNEEIQQVKSGIVIKYEKQRNKKSSWSQHLREQWAKTYAPVSVTVDVDSDPDHHYESLYSEKQQDDDYDSFESDSGSEESFKSDGEYYIQNNQLPKPPNSQPYGIIKFAGKHMKKLKRRSIDLSKSLSRMTKRISRTDSSIPNAVKNGERPLIEPKTNDCETRESLNNQLSVKNFMAKNAVIYENVDSTLDATTRPKDVIQKTGGDQEKERISLLKRIRRSMSMSAESALELTSHLANKPARSTFYLTEEINIDKNENDTALPTNSPTISKSNITRPKSPPPEVPVRNIEQKEPLVKSKNDEDEVKSRTCWYTEIGLYEGPDSTPSTSTAENSGSGISNIDINQDSEDYYNMINKSHSESAKINISKYDEEKNDLEDTLTSTTPDIQLLLQDEPLYQFYDAAVLESICQDSTFQFETDNYEEVDDFSDISSNSGQSPDDIVLPKKTTISFTKTLWCEIPEVIQSSVLSKLSIRQKKLQEAKFEIITSEASYVNSLNVLNDHFALSLKNCDCINEKEWEIVFGKVASVKVCSQRLLQELEKCWQDNILLYGICDVIQTQAEEKFNVYIPYCENQILLSGTLNQLMERPGFVSYLKDLESSSSCQFLTLYSFLMLPMQRITRWPLLVDAVLKRLSESDPEYVVCQHALATLNKIVSQCNEAARKKEREIELQAIANKLEFPKGVIPIHILSQDRWLIRSGPVMSIQQKNEDSKMTFGKRFNKIQLCLYLFNDMFFVTKEKSNESYTILHYCPRNLVELRDADMLVPKKEGYEKNLLFLTILENQDGRTVEFVLSCNKESDKERWIEAIFSPKSEDPEETLYECWDCPQVIASHNYISVQPDELSLSRGDIINVLRKMADGWYHGERIRDGQTGWFPANYTSEVNNPHVRARNLKQRYRLLAFSENYLKSS